MTIDPLAAFNVTRDPEPNAEEYAESLDHYSFPDDPDHPPIAATNGKAKASTNGKKPPERTESTWRPVDLTDALSGADVPPPSELRRSDGIHLLYAGRTHAMAGEPESCKSWAAMVAAVQVLDKGRDVLWIDFEDDARGVVPRLLAMGVERLDIRERFVYVRPEEPLRTRDGRWTPGGVDLDALLPIRPWALIVIDGVTEAMSTEGLDLMSNADIANWTRLLPKRCAATGAAVVMLDHVPKATDNRGRYSIGGQHKLAGITGAQYIFEVERPFSRAKSEPVTGIIKIVVVKDRPGHVRTYGSESIIARLELTSYPDGGVSARLARPDEHPEVIDFVLAGRIADYLTAYDGASKNAVESSVAGNANAIRATLAALVKADCVAVTKRGAGHYHSLTDKGRHDLL